MAKLTSSETYFGGYETDETHVAHMDGHAYRFHITRDHLHDYLVVSMNDGQYMSTTQIAREVAQREYMTEGDLIELHRNYVRARPDYRHPGPSNEELANPALRNAWREFQLIQKLVGGPKN